MRLIDADELRLLAIEKLHMVNPLGDITDLIDEAPTIEPSKSTEQNVADVPSGDLISREEAIKVGNKIVEELSSSSIYWDDLKCWAKELFDALPSADRPKGKWIRVTNGRGGHECSNCHAYAPSYMSGDEHLSDFCPNCGADMRGDVM